jgi:hypothetical protein
VLKFCHHVKSASRSQQAKLRPCLAHWYLAPSSLAASQRSDQSPAGTILRWYRVCIWSIVQRESRLVTSRRHPSHNRYRTYESCRRDYCPLDRDENRRTAMFIAPSSWNSSFAAEKHISIRLFTIVSKLTVRKMYSRDGHGIPKDNIRKRLVLNRITYRHTEHEKVCFFKFAIAVKPH